MTDDQNNRDFPPMPEGPTVVLVGRKGSGKTEFLNFLLGKRKLPCGSGDTTSKPTIVRRAREVNLSDEACSCFPESDEEIDRRLLLKPCVDHDQMVEEEFLELEEPLSWLPEGFRIVDLPGFDSVVVKGKERPDFTTQAWIEEADLILFFANVKGGYKIGHALEFLRPVRDEHNGCDHPRDHMVLLTKSDGLDLENPMETVRKEFKDYCKEKGLEELAGEHCFAIASRVRSDEKLTLLKKDGFFKELKNALSHFREKLTELASLHACRRSAGLLLAAENNNLPQDFRQRAGALENFLEREIQGRLPCLQKLREAVESLEWLESSEEFWISTTGKLIHETKCSFGSRTDDLNQRIGQLYDEAHAASRTWFFWRRNRLFREKLGSTFDEQMSVLLQQIRSNLDKFAEEIARSVAKVVPDFAALLSNADAVRLELSGLVEQTSLEVRQAIRDNFVSSQPSPISALEFIQRPASDLRVRISRIRSFVRSLGRSEREKYLQISRDVEEMAKECLKQTMDGLREQSVSESATLGHKLRVAAKNDLRGALPLQETEEERMAIFEYAKENLGRARKLASE